MADSSDTQAEEEQSLIEMMMGLSRAAPHEPGRDPREDFIEGTILGSDINQIRHLFYFLQSEKRRVLVNYGGEIYHGHVTRVEDMRATLSFGKFSEDMIRRCRIKFEIINVLYQFEVPIVDMGDNWISIRMPGFIQSATRRQNRRVFLDDLYMRWIIAYRPLFGRRSLDQIAESRFGPIIRELRKDHPDLRLIHRILVEEVQKISPDFQMRFYEKGEDHSLAERMILEQRKTLFIRRVNQIDSYYQPVRRYGLINFYKEYQLRAGDVGEEEAVKFFEDVQREDMHNFVATYLISPLMIFDRVIGHLYVYQTVFDRAAIDYDQAVRIDMLVRLLNHAMSKTVLARTYYRHTFTRISNISMSGLLFELADQQIFDFLTYNDHIKMLIQVRHHTLELHGEITRYFPRGDDFNVGVQFYHAGPSDLKILETFIHDRARADFG